MGVRTMKRTNGLLIGFGLTLIAASSVSCDDGDNQPGLQIMDPAAGESVELEADLLVPIRISVTDFEVEAQGACTVGDDDDAVCGQVVVKIDGNACNRPGTDYNNILTDDSSSIDADFSQCPQGTVLGIHNITVRLVPDATTAPGQPLVEASVSVITVPKT